MKIWAVLLREVPDRREVILRQLILEWILPGMRIVLDGWVAYANIQTMDGDVYMHDVVIHEQHFVDRDDYEVHTQNIENMWMRVKRKYPRQFDTSRELYPYFLCLINIFVIIWFCFISHILRQIITDAKIGHYLLMDNKNSVMIND